MRTVKQFFFKERSHKDVTDIINQDLPCSLEHNEDLINRIHARYPLIGKTEVSLIIKAVFQSMRELLIMGKILNFNTLFCDTKLHFFNYVRNGVSSPALKVKISTSIPLR